MKLALSCESFTSNEISSLIFLFLKGANTFESRHVIHNNVAFLQVSTQTSLRNLLLSLETPKYCSVSSLTLIEYSSD